MFFGFQAGALDLTWRINLETYRQQKMLATKNRRDQPEGSDFCLKMAENGFLDDRPDASNFLKFLNESVKYQASRYRNLNKWPPYTKGHLTRKTRPGSPNAFLYLPKKAHTDNENY